MPRFDMDPRLQNWVSYQAHKNLWAMPPYLSYEDLIQEGMYYWTHVNNKYYEKVTDPPHMVSLFMTAYTRRLIDLRYKRTPDVVSIEDNAAIVELLAEEPSLAQFAINAPEPIASIIRLLTDPNEGIVCPPFHKFPDGSRDTINNRLHRKLATLGIEATGSLLKQLRAYLKRERLYDTPTVIECVGVMVDKYLELTLDLPEHCVNTARQHIKKHLYPRERLTIQGMQRAREKQEARKKLCIKSQERLSLTPGTASLTMQANAATSTDTATYLSAP